MGRDLRKGAEAREDAVAGLGCCLLDLRLSDLALLFDSRPDFHTATVANHPGPQHNAAPETDRSSAWRNMRTCAVVHDRARSWPVASMETPRTEPDASSDRPPIWTSVYGELKTLARQLLANERQGHTLQPTALVHEAFLRLNAHRALAKFDRLEFYRAAANAMRRILVDHARHRLRQKRQPGLPNASPAVSELLADTSDPDRILDIDAALAALEGVSPRLAEIVRLRFFAGLTEDEIAELLSVSRRTIQYDFRTARAWLRRRLDSDQSEPHEATSDPNS